MKIKAIGNLIVQDNSSSLFNTLRIFTLFWVCGSCTSVTEKVIFFISCNYDFAFQIIFIFYKAHFHALGHTNFYICLAGENWQDEM